MACSANSSPGAGSNGRMRRSGRRGSGCVPRLDLSFKNKACVWHLGTSINGLAPPPPQHKHMQFEDNGGSLARDACTIKVHDQLWEIEAGVVLPRIKLGAGDSESPVLTIIL